MPDVTPKRVIVYRTPDGQEPFTEWLETLRDSMMRKRILARLTRLEQGNYADCKPVGEGGFRITPVLWPRLSGLFW